MPGLPPQFTSSALPVQPPAPNYSISVISTQHALPPVSTADSIFRYAAAVQQLCSRKAELCECASPARGNAAWWYMVCSCSTLVTCLAGRGPAIGHSNSWGPVGATGLQEQQAAAHRPPSSADSSLQCATHTRTTVEQATDYEHCHPRLPCISLARLGSVHSAQQHVHSAVAAVADTSKPTSEGSDSVRDCWSSSGQLSLRRSANSGRAALHVERCMQLRDMMMRTVEWQQFSTWVGDRSHIRCAASHSVPPGSVMNHQHDLGALHLCTSTDCAPHNLRGCQEACGCLHVLHIVSGLARLRT